MLLEAKADPRCKDRWGNTPWSEAQNAIKDNRATSELLSLLVTYLEATKPAK
jgi:hypothetical protein